MTAPSTWNGKAEKEERAIRFTIIAVAHGLLNMLMAVFILGAGAFEYGIYAFTGNSILTIFFLNTYFVRWRQCALNELMLLEALGVTVCFTLGAGYVINRGIWLLVLRPF